MFSDLGAIWGLMGFLYGSIWTPRGHFLGSIWREIRAPSLVQGTKRSRVPKSCIFECLLGVLRVLFETIFRTFWRYLKHMLGVLWSQCFARIFKVVVDVWRNRRLGVSPTGKLFVSFRLLVRACARSGCKVKIELQNSCTHFPFSLLAPGSFPFSLEVVPPSPQPPIQLQLALSVFAIFVKEL